MRASTEMDAAIGARVRERRRQQKITQSELGAILGVSFQQVQKYESGTNRIGSGRLAEIANALDIPVASFYAAETGLSNQLNSHFVTQLNLRLLKAFVKLDKTFARQFVVLAEHIATKQT